MSKGMVIHGQDPNPTKFRKPRPSPAPEINLGKAIRHAGATDALQAARAKAEAAKKEKGDESV